MSIFKSKATREQEARIRDLQDIVISDAVAYVKELDHPVPDFRAKVIVKDNLVESVHNLREERGW